MDRKLRRTASILLAALALTACSRCGHPTVASNARSPAELAPANAELAIYVPHLLALGQKAQRLSQLKVFGLAATLSGLGDNGAVLLDQVKRQLGFDFTTREGLEKVGLDPDGPLLSVHAGAVSLAVGGVGNATRLDAAIGILARERLRAPNKSEKDGVTVYSSAGGAPVLAYARAEKLALLATGAGCVEALTAALAQDAAHSLAARPEYAGFAAAHTDADLLAWSPKDTSLDKLRLEHGLAVAVSLEPHRARAELDLPLDAAEATALASLHGEAGSALVPRLDPDAFLVARTAIDPATLWPVVKAFTPRQLELALARLGIKPAEALAGLKPGTALSLALPPTLDLGRMPSFDPRETNPFRYVNLAALGSLQDPTAAAKMLAEASKVSDRVGATVEQKAVGKAAVYTFKYALGEGASIALAGNELAVSGGEGRMAALLGRAADGGAKLPADVAPKFSKAGLAVWLDVPRVVRSLRALPDSAFGLGGFAIKAAMNRWLDAVEEIHGALLLADTRADARGSTLHVELQADLP